MPKQSGGAAREHFFCERLPASSAADAQDQALLNSIDSDSSRAPSGLNSIAASVSVSPSILARTPTGVVHEASIARGRIARPQFHKMCARRQSPEST